MKNTFIELNKVLSIKNNDNNFTEIESNGFVHVFSSKKDEIVIAIEINTEKDKNTPINETTNKETLFAEISLDHAILIHKVLSKLIERKLQ